MDDKYKKYSVVTVILIGLYLTVDYFFIPEITNNGYDVAAAVWFVALPLYLFVKRKWVAYQLTQKWILGLDAFLFLVSNSCLGYAAVSVEKGLLVRVLFVWLACLVLWFFIYRTKSQAEEE